MKKNIRIFSFGVSALLISAGFLVAVSLVQAADSTIQEAGSAPSEMLSSSEVFAKANAVVATTTFLLRQNLGSATLNSVTVVITDPSTGLVNTDIASVSLRKESGATSNFQVAEDLVVPGAGASAITPTIGTPITLTPTPEAIGANIVQYYIVITIAASPANGHSLAVNLGTNYGIDSIGGTVGTALTATKKITIDTVVPSDPSAANYILSQNAPGTADLIMVKTGESAGIAGNTIRIYASNGTTLLGSGLLGGSPNAQFDAISIGNNTNASVKVEFADPAGNTSAQVEVTGNDIVNPTAIATAYTDRIIIQFSEQIDGMMAMNCANYTIGGTILTCGGMGLPYVDVQGDKITIKGLNLSGTTSLVIASGNTITDINGRNPVTAYNSGTISVGALSLPTISSLSVETGAVGGSITITGTNFGTGTGGDANHKVFFSGGFSPTTGPLPSVEATSFTSWSDTSIVVTVPAGTQGGPVNVMSGGVMSDMNQNSFFDISASYVTKIYYDSVSTLMPDIDKDNIRIVIGGMRGPEVHYDGDGTTTYNAAADTFTITGVSSMGWTWAYDITGTHLNSLGQQVDVSATQNHILKTTTRKISGTITLGASCADAGKNQNVVIFAMPDQVDTGNANFKSMDPAFFKTNTSCTINYSVGIPMNGVYRVEADIPPNPSSITVSSATFTTPDSLSVTISDSAPTATGKNFTFTSATHRIVGTVQKPSGSFGGDERGMLWVFAYQPRENGKGTGTQVASDGTFTLYVVPGTWKVGVGGENMSFPVEVQVDVDDTYLIASSAKGPTIIIAPPSDFIEGYVKDSAGNGLANSSLYAWLEGGPGGGNAQTDSQGYYKMYVTPGSNYNIGANSQSYGFLGEQSNIAVTSSTHPTVNFTVSSSNNYIISGTVTKGGSPLQQAFVFITEGEFGPMLGSGGTDATGVFSTRVSGGANRWIHVGLPGKGEVYLVNLNTISADTALGTIAITASTIKVRISPASSFTQAFVGTHSDTGGGFSDTDVAVGQTYREYQIDVRQPASGSTTYYVDGGIPGYGPLPQTTIVVNSGGTFTESSGTANDGIIEITLGGLWTVSGTVSGTNVKDAWVFASGPSGGGGAAADADGLYSFQLRDGTYDIGVGKPGYIGNKITAIVNGINLGSQNLTLTTATNTITGTVYLPNGTTTATNAKVWAENGSGGWAGGSTDASGNYTLSVDSGSWTVKAAYDGYNSTRILVTAPASGKNITLVTVSGFAPNTKNSPITPSSGGIVSGTGIKVDFPKNALGTGTSAGTVEVKSTTNVVLKNDRQLIGTAKEITARNSSNQNVTTLSGSITIELTVTKAELIAANLTFAQAQAIKITYYDSTGGSWVEIPTVVTLSVPSATTIAGLDDDPAITLTGTTTHLSTYAPSIPTDSDAPPVPTGLSATASDVSAVLSWTASAGATKYDIYKKVGADYPYLAQTTSTSYTATGLTNGTIYYFKVSALDSSSPNKESAATTEVSVTPVAPSGSGRHGSSTASATSAVSTVTPAGTAVPATPVVGCSGGNLFNTQTGAACVNNAVIPQGCSGGNLFNTSTGAACPVSATPATPATPAVPGVSSATPATPATPASYNFGISTLKNGSKGEGVKELQRFLNVKLNLGLVIDGKLGPKTIAVIKTWQKNNGLVADGLVGAKTKAKMNAQ